VSSNRHHHDLAVRQSDQLQGGRLHLAIGVVVFPWLKVFALLPFTTHFSFKGLLDKVYFFPAVFVQLFQEI